MNTGIIANAKRSQSGKSLGVLIGDQWYQTKNWALENAIGRTIEYEVTTSEYRGKTYYWLDKESLVGNGTPHTGQSNAPTTASPRSSIPAPDNMAFMPFVSNTVAHAIQAGLIKAPADISKWAAAAFVAGRDIGAGQIGGVPRETPDDDFDDDIPF